MKEIKADAMLRGSPVDIACCMPKIAFTKERAVAFVGISRSTIAQTVVAYKAIDNVEIAERFRPDRHSCMMQCKDPFE